MNQAMTIHGVKLCTRSAFLFFMFLTIVSVGKAWAQLEPLGLYDDFTAPKISTTKWLGGESLTGLGREVNRVISNGRLQLMTRAGGFTAFNTGVGSNLVFLTLPEPDAVNEMQAKITVSSLSVPSNGTGCTSNTNLNNATQAYALLTGSFFNTAPRLDGDQTNDVIASIGIQSPPPGTPSGTLVVVASVTHCTNSSCVAPSVLDFESLGTVAIGTGVKLTMQWDQANHKFIFTRGSRTPIEFIYGVPDTSPPGLPSKNLEVFTNVANCTTTPAPVASISALFDNVNLNQSALP